MKIMRKFINFVEIGGIYNILWK